MRGNQETPNGTDSGVAADDLSHAGDRMPRPPSPSSETSRRARDANGLRIEQEIRARYAGELATADICDQLQIEVRIRTEIEQALAAAAPGAAGS